jgi:DNA-binding NarL/FixJ family response regulator
MSKNTAMIEVLLVDDHALVREGLRSLLERYADIAVIEEAAGGREALLLIRQLQPDVVILDLSMPDMDGIEVTRQVRREGLKTKVLVVTMHFNEQYAIRLLGMGAQGFIGKGAQGREVAEAIRTVAAGNWYLPPALLKKLPKPYTRGGTGNSPLETLSHRELQVLKGLAEGRTGREIGEALHLSVKTVDAYRARLLTKLNLDTTANLIRFALHHRVIEEPW